MTQLTPEEIQQAEEARARVIAQLYRVPDSDAVTVPKSDLRALLALTEQLEALPEWQCPGCGATTRARMADQQPEPDLDRIRRKVETVQATVRAARSGLEHTAQELDNIQRAITRKAGA